MTNIYRVTQVTNEIVQMTTEELSAIQDELFFEGLVIGVAISLLCFLFYWIFRKYTRSWKYGDCSGEWNENTKYKKF